MIAQNFQTNQALETLNSLSLAFSTTAKEITYIDFNAKTNNLQIKKATLLTKEPYDRIHCMIDSIIAVHTFLCLKQSPPNKSDLMHLNITCCSLRKKIIQEGVKMNEMNKTCFLSLMVLIFKDLKPQHNIRFIIDPTIAIDTLFNLVRAFDNIEIFNNELKYGYLKYDATGHLLKKINLDSKSIPLLALSIEAVFQFLSIEGITQSEYNILCLLVEKIPFNDPQLQESIAKLKILKPRLRKLNEVEEAIHDLATKYNLERYNLLRQFFTENKSRAGDIPEYEDSFLIPKLNICLENLRRPVGNPKRLLPLYNITEQNINFLSQKMTTSGLTVKNKEIYNKTISDLKILCLDMKIVFPLIEDQDVITQLRALLKMAAAIPNRVLETIPIIPTPHFQNKSIPPSLLSELTAKFKNQSK